MPTKTTNNCPIYAGAAILCVLILTAGAIFALSTMPKTAWTGSKNSTGTLSSVSVSATGFAKGVPSSAMISLYINGTGNSSKAATLNLSSRINAFNSTISSYLGGNLSLVQTSYYNVYKQYSNRSNAPPVYNAQEYITVTLPQISKLDSFLVTVTNVTGVEIQGVSATLSDQQTSTLRQQALQYALQNATMQATGIIGNAAIVNTTISVGSYYATPYPLYATSSSGNAGGIAIPPRLFYNGTSSVTESIQATFYYRR